MTTPEPPYQPVAPTLAGEITDASEEGLPGSATGLVGELSPTDVQQYTNGRLSAANPETARMLNAALVAARREVGWHVSPVKTGDTMVLDGPGWHMHKLRLPTRKIVQLNSVVNDGVTLDISFSPTAQVVQSAQVPWLLVRRHGHWTHHYAAIVVNLDHGFDIDEAADWRQAILSMVDQMVTIVTAGRPDVDLQSKQIDDVVYRWGAAQALPGAAPILEQYMSPLRRSGMFV